MDEKSFVKDHVITEVIKFQKGKHISVHHPVIREIPIQICINKTPCATLMYTPGQEKELAVGFCFTEGILSASWVKSNLRWEKFDPQQRTINFTVDQPIQPRAAAPLMINDFLESSTHTNNANRVLPSMQKITSNLRVSFEILQKIEKQIRGKQKLFSLTGAAHAACVFDGEGNYLFCCEDIARHNALDKAIGHALLKGIVFSDKIVCLSGRTNYTLMKKAACAQMPIVAAVSAPTSMAVKISREADITLIGFLRSEEMNIYAGRQRIKK